MTPAILAGLAALWLVPLAAEAQGAASGEDLVFDAAPAQACREAAATAVPGTSAACAGRAADACMQATPGGVSTAGMGGCLAAELDWWDAALNDAYVRLKPLETGNDTVLPSGMALRPSAALTDMQRSWIAFRDARCAYVHAQWGGGTGGGPAELACRLQVTAEQTLFLDARLRDLTTRG